jgi:hypothetical protein
VSASDKSTEDCHLSDRHNLIEPPREGDAPVIELLTRKSYRRAVATYTVDTPRIGGCPGYEALTAFVERRLAGAERDVVVSHLAECEACYFAVTEAAAAVPSADPHWSWRAAAILASAALIALATAAGLVWQRHTGTIVSAGTNPVGSSSRITQRSASSTSGKTDGSEERQQETADERLAKALADSAAMKEKAGTNLRAKYVPATELNARAAAYLSQWQRSHLLKDAVAAADAARTAVDNDPRLLDARLNLARALEAMSSSLRDESARAWQRYLAGGPAEVHAGEARLHLRALQAMKAAEQH